MIEDNDSEIISISNTSDTSQELDVEVKGIRRGRSYWKVAKNYWYLHLFLPKLR